jgi:predicted alpha/beta-hydrolase family hydrolase
LSTIASYLPAQPLAHAVGIALGHTAGHSWLPARDLVVLAAWAIAGMAIAVITFRWEPHRPTQRRPARPSQQTSPTDRGTDSNLSGSSASTATTATPMRFGATTPSHA